MYWILYFEGGCIISLIIAFIIIYFKKKKEKKVTHIKEAETNEKDGNDKNTLRNIGLFYLVTSPFILAEILFFLLGLDLYLSTENILGKVGGILLMALLFIHPGVTILLAYALNKRNKDNQ
ncbi:MAG: hypothetical protein ACFFCI_01050 [Promethearchaeota archaeon]